MHNLSGEERLEAIATLLSEGVSPKTASKLTDLNVTSLAEIRDFTDTRLDRLYGIGPRTIDDIRDALASTYSLEEPQTFSIGSDWEQPN